MLIENQLERTDHVHLGQLLTYAAGLNAVTIVWIAERFTEEHRAALDWLNERTDEKVNFFGLEVELWQIGESAIARKFNVISQPNDWSRTVQQAAAGDFFAPAVSAPVLDGLQRVHGIVRHLHSLPEAAAATLDKLRDWPVRRASCRAGSLLVGHAAGSFATVMLSMEGSRINSTRSFSSVNTR